MDSGEGNAKRPTDAKNTIKDNAQAGIPAKRDFFLVSFFIIVCLGFNTYAFFVFLKPKPGLSSWTSISMNFANRLRLVSGFFALVNPYAMV